MKRLTPILAVLLCSSAFAGQHAEALGKCLYQNANGADRDTLIQWAYVAIGNTGAAKQISSIPAARTTEVNGKAKTLISRLTLNACRKQALAVATNETRDGLQNAVTSLTNQIIAEQVKSYAKNIVSSQLGTSGTATITEGVAGLKKLLKK